MEVKLVFSTDGVVRWESVDNKNQVTTIHARIVPPGEFKKRLDVVLARFGEEGTTMGVIANRLRLNAKGRQIVEEILQTDDYEVASYGRGGKPKYRITTM